MTTPIYDALAAEFAARAAGAGEDSPPAKATRRKASKAAKSTQKAPGRPRKAASAKPGKRPAARSTDAAADSP
jgi:hypothetical protein